MSYACGYIVYGYAVSEGVDQLQAIEEDESITDERYGDISEFLELPYNGGGDGFGYVGKVIMHVDECRNYDLTRLLGFQPTGEMDAEIDVMVEKLPDYAKAVLGERKLWLTWGSS